MHNKNIEEILDQCIESLKRGSTIEDCIERFHEYRKELEPLLVIISKIEKMPKPEPRKEAIYKALIEAGKLIPSHKKRKLLPGHDLRFISVRRQALIRAFVIFLVIVFAGSAAINVSANSKPGDFLYPIKLMTERVKFFLTINPEGKAELRLAFAEKRMQELIIRLNKDKSLDKELLAAMLNQAELALNQAENIPKQKKAIFYTKFNYFNGYQKDVLESIRFQVPQGQQRNLKRAIEICGNRSKWMRQMMRQSTYRPWRRGMGCSWH